MSTVNGVFQYSPKTRTQFSWDSNWESIQFNSHFEILPVTVTESHLLEKCWPFIERFFSHLKMVSSIYKTNEILFGYLIWELANTFNWKSFKIFTVIIKVISKSPFFPVKICLNPAFQACLYLFLFFIFCQKCVLIALAFFALNCKFNFE